MKIIETFLSIQGEGVNSGLPTYFIRLAGCNLRCSYCDTKYSYSGGEEKNVEEIFSELKNKSSQFKHVCITGGEPLLQAEVKDLIKILLTNNYQVDIETNGSILLKDFPNSEKLLYSLDIKCPSSGSSAEMKLENLNYVQKKDQVKFIIQNDDDYKFSKKVLVKYNLIEKTNVIFTPVGGIKAEKLVEKILQDNLNIRIGLQIHKVIWGDKQGV